MLFKQYAQAGNGRLLAMILKEINRPTKQPEPRAKKTITRKSIYTYTTSYSFNDSINDNIPFTGRGPNSIVRFVHCFRAK